MLPHWFISNMRINPTLFSLKRYVTQIVYNDIKETINTILDSIFDIVSH